MSTVRDYPLDEITLPMGGTTVKDEAKMEEIWESDEYVAEEKYDGSRYLSIGGRFFSRRVSVVDHLPVEKTDNVPHLSKILALFPNLILDGEVYLEGQTSNEVTSIMGATSEKALWRQGFGEFEEPLLVGGEGKWRLGSSHEWVVVPKKEVIEIIARQGMMEPLSYVVYDILRDKDGNWLIDLPWKERRLKLYEALQEIPDRLPFIKVSAVVEDNKKEFCAEVMARGGEGVMLKNINGKYTPGKKPRWNWIKVKQEITADVIITGFKPAVREYTGKELDSWQYWENLDKDNPKPVVKVEGTLDKKFGLDEDGIIKYVRRISPNGGMDTDEFPMFEPVTKYYYHDWIGSIEFSQYNADGELVPMGECSGITEELRKAMSENPEAYIGQVMEISAMQMTKDGFFRHPQYLRLRDDKNPEDCIVGQL